MTYTIKSLILSIVIFTVSFEKTAMAQMNWNQAAGFAGNSSSYISVPNSSSVNITGSFTIEAWINPSSVSGVAKGIAAKGSTLGTSLRYGLRLLNGRILFLTNGVQRLITKTATSVSVNKWTHVSATYNSSTNLFSLYINGSLDTSAVVSGAAPESNTDSLFIGISGSTTPFSGQMDELRIWNKTLTSSNVQEYYRSVIADTTSVYNGLVLSMTFQDADSQLEDFNTLDMSGNNNNGNARNVSEVNKNNSPYSTIHPNEAMVFNGTSTSYLSGVNTSSLSAQLGITIEFWVFMTSAAQCNFVSKGSANPVYQVFWTGTKLSARINNISMSPVFLSIPLFKWTHVAFRYSNDGIYRFYVNGVISYTGLENAGNINLNNDSLFIGGGPGALAEMSGYMDEVRIWKNISRPDIDILNSVYHSYDKGNEVFTSETKVSYNFDGSLKDNSDHGGPRLRMNGNCKFTHPASTGLPVSPLAKDVPRRFGMGYYTNTSNKTIPQSGTSGLITDTISVNENLNISDLNLFIAATHADLTELTISLAAPNGDSVTVFNQQRTNSSDGNIHCIFDDNADSTLSDLRYVSFCPTMKPQNSINSMFSGDNAKGKWILRIRDNTSGDTGFLYAWGMHFNNNLLKRINFDVKALLQGFYNPSTNKMTNDTLKLYARAFNSPYASLDSSKVVLDSTGKGLFSLKVSLYYQNIQMQMIHRNSIETWASGGLISLELNDNYNFTGSTVFAYGENMVLVDLSPVQYAFYGGDVNQDDIVDATDAGAVDNDASNFTTGYVNTDVTGDDVVDAADALIVENNAANFVTAVTP